MAKPSYTGRATEEPNAYLYQRIEVLEPGTPLPTLRDGQRGAAIIGYAVDEGVRLNQGRTGAADGPAALRASLGREVDRTGGSLRVVDLGDVTHAGERLSDTLRALSREVARAREAGYYTVVLGGGHDLAAGHYAGLHRYAAPDTSGALGVVNFDAHLDLRPLGAQGPTSGTPFTLIAQRNVERQQPFRYACVGVQDTANTAGLLQRARDLGVVLVPLREMATAEGRLTGFGESCTALHVTVDLDGFPAEVSPGVSAPGVDGLGYRAVRGLLWQLVASGKVIGFDVAECNPTYDIDGRTARLGARLVSDFLEACA